MKAPAILIAAFCLALPASSTTADIYTWTDANGVEHLSDRKPVGQQHETRVTSDRKATATVTPAHPIAARCVAKGSDDKDLGVATVFCKAFGDSGVERVQIDETIMQVTLSPSLYLGIRMRPDRDLLLKRMARKFMEVSRHDVVTAWYYVGRERVAEVEYRIWSGDFEVAWK